MDKSSDELSIIGIWLSQKKKKKSKKIGKDIKILGLLQRSSFPHSPTHVWKKKKKKENRRGGTRKV